MWWGWGGGWISRQCPDLLCLVRLGAELLALGTFIVRGWSREDWFVSLGLDRAQHPFLADSSLFTSHFAQSFVRPTSPEVLPWLHWGLTSPWYSRSYSATPCKGVLTPTISSPFLPSILGCTFEANRLVLCPLVGRTPSALAIDILMEEIKEFRKSSPGCMTY